MPKKGRIGVHERLEFEVSKRKYPVKAYRQGYNTPNVSDWRIVDYRVKEEVLPEFVRDIRPLNLNPYPNNIKLFPLLFSHKKWYKKWFLYAKDRKWCPSPPRGTTYNKPHKIETVGRSLGFIQWGFKWLNRKKLMATILILLGIVTWQLWLLPVALLVLMNPLKPVPVYTGDAKREPFVPSYNYNICLGYLKDPNEYDIKTHEVIQKDVL